VGSVSHDDATILRQRIPNDVFAVSHQMMEQIGQIKISKTKRQTSPTYMPIEDIEVRGDNGKIEDISPERPVGKQGFRKEIAFLPGGGDTTIRLSFKFNSDNIRPASRAALQADIYIQKIPTLLPDMTKITETKKKLIQRRIFVASCQPKFDDKSDANVVLVTTTGSKPDQVEAWETLFLDRLGFKSQVYSLSRYGHLDASKVPETRELKESVADKLVVVLNEEYIPQPNAENTRKKSSRPSLFINSTYDFDPSTRFLVVGGDVKTVDHLSPEAMAVTKHTSESPNRKKFWADLGETLETERSKGFSPEREEPKCHIVTIKTRTAFRPGTKTVDRILETRANRMAKKLKAQDALRPYMVEWAAHSDPHEVEKEGLMTLWAIGEIRVRTGTPRSQDDVTMVEGTSASCMFWSSDCIQSSPMLFGAVSALSFDHKMKCFERSLRHLAESIESAEPDDHQEICRVVVDCLVRDFLWDISNYCDGHMKVKEPLDRSRTVQGLVKSKLLCEIVEEAVSNDRLCSVLREQLSVMVAGFKSVAESRDLRPYWNPFSRKHVVRKEFRESISLLEESWSHVLDGDSILDASRNIEKAVRSHLVQRKKFWKRAHGRWRGGLNHVFSPKNEDRYKRSPGFAAATTRVRRHSEFSCGGSMKIKAAAPPETLNPEASREFASQQENRLSYRGDVFATTNSDNDLFRQ